LVLAEWAEGVIQQATIQHPVLVLILFFQQSQQLVAVAQVDRMPLQL
jgi:hypothetical protein